MHGRHCSTYGTPHRPSQPYPLYHHDDSFTPHWTRWTTMGHRRHMRHHCHHSQRPRRRQPTPTTLTAHNGHANRMGPTGHTSVAQTLHGMATSVDTGLDRPQHAPRHTHDAMVLLPRQSTTTTTPQAPTGALHSTCANDTSSRHQRRRTTSTLPDHTATTEGTSC